MKKKRLIYSVILILVVVLIVLAFVRFKYNDEIIVENKASTRYDSVTIAISEVKKIKLDSVTSPGGISYCKFWLNANGKRFLVYLNSGAKTLYFNDFESGENTTTLFLKRFGINDKDQTQGFELISEDSILLYNYNGTTLSLISASKGKLLQKTLYPRLDESNLDLVVPFVSNTSPILYSRRSSTVYLSGLFGDEGGTKDIDRKRKNLLSLNLKTGDLSTFLYYPKFYWGANWGGIGGYRMPSYDTIANNQLIISFMADHNLTIYDLKSKSNREVYAGSKYIDKIKSMRYSGNYFDFISSEEKRGYYMNNPSYSAVIYDRYRKVYYRFSQLPKSAKFKQPTLIVLNDKFQIIGETILPEDKFYIQRFFLNEKGLWVLEVPQSDDIATFRLLEVKRLI